MGFWIFMFVIILIIPLIMVIVGWRFSKRAPKKINMIYGYRTTMSMKNMDTWKFAHKMIGKIWLYSGLVLLPPSIIPLFFFIGSDSETIGLFAAVIVSVQTVVCLVTIFPVEAALKKTFDKDGRRKQ